MNRYDTWLVDFVNADRLVSMDMELDDYACIDAVDMVSLVSTCIIVS